MFELIAYAIITCSTLTVVDGDTIKCDGVRMRLIGAGVPHISGFDTPEKRGRDSCRHERELADKAANRLKELLSKPGFRIEDSGEIERWGRPLVRIRLADGRTAGAVLLDEGVAKEWMPGYRRSWCG